MKLNKLIIWIFVVLVLNNIVYSLSDEKLVGWWVGDNYSDSTGQVSDLTNSGTTINDSCIVGNCWRATGSGNYIDASSQLDLVLDPLNGSLLIWIYQENHNVDNGNYVWFGLAPGQNRFYGYVGTNGNFFLGFGTNGAIDTGYAINTNEWYRIEVTWNSTDYKFYVNASLEDEGSTFDWTSFDLGTFNLFDISSSPSFEFDGKIDELSLWNRSLSQQEIQEDFDNKYTFPLPQIINAPLLLNPRCTSCKTDTNLTDTFTPTTNISCQDDSSCAGVCITNQSALNYTECVSNGGNCTQGSGDDWICTIITNDKFTFGNNTAFFTATDSTNSHSVYNASINISVSFLAGNITDSDNLPIDNAIIWAMDNNTGQPVIENTTSDSGLWSMIVPSGSYTVCGYDPFNISLRGDCTPFIEVI
jgi:hypothetical protein